MVVRVHWVLYSIFLVLGSVREAYVRPSAWGEGKAAVLQGHMGAVRLPCGASCAPCVRWSIQVKGSNGYVGTLWFWPAVCARRSVRRQKPPRRPAPPCLQPAQPMRQGAARRRLCSQESARRGQGFRRVFSDPAVQAAFHPLCETLRLQPRHPHRLPPPPGRRSKPLRRFAAAAPQLLLHTRRLAAARNSRPSIPRALSMTRKDLIQQKPLSSAAHKGRAATGCQGLAAEPSWPEGL